MATLLHAEERVFSLEAAPPELIVEGASPKEISVQYYEVEGTTLEALKGALKHGGPRDDLGVSRDAFAGWHLTWRWPLTPDGRPDFTRTTVACTGKVILPRWRPPQDVQPELVTEWHRYLEALIRHERKHLEHCFSNRHKVRQAVVAEFESDPELTTDDANALVRRHLREIRSLDLAYDSATDHGRKEGVTLGP